MKNGGNSHQPLNHMMNRLNEWSILSASHGHFKLADDGQIRKNTL